MIEQLTRIGMNEKEARVYLYLIEYGISWASEIAKHLGYPKSTVNFLAESLWKRGYLSKSMRVNTHYYEADLSLIETILLREREEKDQFIETVLPLLRAKNANTHAKPKILFFDGIENCRKAYSELLDIDGTFYEFWAHADLVDAFGTDFMDAFIRERVQWGIFCDSIGTVWVVEKALQEKDSTEMRSLLLFDGGFGTIGSSIALYDDKVLILNLRGIFSGVRIQNREFAETMKTIFRICKCGVEIGGRRR